MATRILRQKGHPELHKQRVVTSDLDIEYVLQTRMRMPKAKRLSAPRIWKTVLTTPSLKDALKNRERLLAKGQRVRVFKYTIEVVKEELF